MWRVAPHSNMAAGIDRDQIGTKRRLRPRGGRGAGRGPAATFLLVATNLPSMGVGAGRRPKSEVAEAERWIRSKRQFLLRST